MWNLNVYDHCLSFYFEIVSVFLLISSTVWLAFWKRWAWSSIPTDFNVLNWLIVNGFLIEFICLIININSATM